MIYEYGCKNCGHQFEEIQKLTDICAECPKCHVVCHNRLISKCAFQLKGSGWAADNYMKKD